MPWVRRRYRGNKVWVEVDDAEALVLDARGLGRMRYKPEDDRTYTIKASEVRPVEAPASDAGPAADSPRPRAPGPKSDADDEADADAAAAREDGFAGSAAASGPEAVSDGPGDDIPALAGLAVHAYTDGASLGNPGPAGAGVVLLFREHRKEVGVYLGVATNNVAELTAVLEALRLVKRRDLPVRVHVDSSYTIGVLDGSFRAKANRELIAKIHEEMKKGFGDLRFVKVEAHVGIEWNERADALAGQAAKSKRSFTTSI